MSQAFSYTDSRGVSHLEAALADPHAVLAAELGPDYALYRRQWEAARDFLWLPPFPLQVDYELMFRCNLRCPICLMSLPAAERARYGEARQELSAQTVAELIAEGASQGQKALGFGGLWEPLLSPELPELVAEGRGRGLVDVICNTNGLLLSEKLSRALIKAGLTKLMISLDAVSESVYARQRPGGELREVEANINAFLALRRQLGRRLPLLRVSFCRTVLNEGELEAFVRRWTGAADFLSVQVYGRYHDGAPDFPSSGPSAAAPGRCAQPHKRLLVRHNGQVCPCCDASGLELSLGSIYEKSLAELWRSHSLAELRRLLEAGSFSGPAEICRRCQSKFGPRAEEA